MEGGDKAAARGLKRWLGSKGHGPIVRQPPEKRRLSGLPVKPVGGQVQVQRPHVKAVGAVTDPKLVLRAGKRSGPYSACVVKEAGFLWPVHRQCAALFCRGPSVFFLECE